jgi:hypothetical protein
MDKPALPVMRPAPRGLSFGISEHLEIRKWAARRNLQVVTELDRVICGEEYEEVLAFYHPNSSWRRLTLWRKADGIVLEPSVGAARLFPSVTEATLAANSLMQVSARRSVITRSKLRPR